MTSYLDNQDDICEADADRLTFVLDQWGASKAAAEGLISKWTADRIDFNTLSLGLFSDH